MTSKSSTECRCTPAADAAETIEIIATKPDELSVQIALGNSHFSSRAEHDRQLISTIEEERLYSVQDREDAYERDPEGAL